MTERVLMNAEDVRRAIVRIAHEIVEAHRGSRDLVLIGMRTRGVPMAQRLRRDDPPRSRATRCRSARSTSASTATTFPTRGPSFSSQPSDLPDRHRRRAASCWSTTCSTPDAPCAPPSTRSSRLGRPKRIQLAVLVDRGHRELPIRPDYVGKNIPTTHADDVRVRLHETDGHDEVASARRRRSSHDDTRDS